MWFAIFRKARADLAGQKLQTGLTFVAIAVAIGTMTLAVVMTQSIDRAYADRIEETRGPHAVFQNPGGVMDPDYLTPIGELDGVSGVAGPYPVLFRGAFLLADDRAVDVDLLGITYPPPAIGTPLVTNGEWLVEESEHEIVLDHGVARELGIDVGEHVEILAPSGTESFQVVGLAVTSDRLAYPGWSNSFGIVLPDVIERLDADGTLRGWRLAVELDEPDQAREFAIEARRSYPTDVQPGFSTWTRTRDDLISGFEMASTVIGFFGFIAIGAASFVIVNLIGGYVLTRSRDIGLLKATGFTPRQIAVLLLVEHVGVALPASAIGLILGLASAPAILGLSAEALGTTPDPTIGVLQALAILLGVPLAFAVIAVIPAWRASGLPTVRALGNGGVRAASGASWLARVATRLRMPSVVVLGMKDILNRPLRAGLTVAALTGTVVLGMVTLGIDNTFRDVINNPAIAGESNHEIDIDRYLSSTRISDQNVREMLAARSEVVSYQPRKRLFVEYEDNFGGMDSFPAFVVENTPAEVIPHLSAGKMFAGDGEAVISRELADLTGSGVGDEIELTIRSTDTFAGFNKGDPEVLGSRLTLRVAGAYVRDGLELIFSGDTLEGQIGKRLEPFEYAVKLSEGADAEAFKAGLIVSSSGQLRVFANDSADENRRDRRVFLPILYGITGGLLLIGTINLLIALSFGVRERIREFGVIKTLGFTPGQILMSISISAAMFSVVAVTIGVPIGLLFTRWSLNYIGEEAGLGSPFGSMPEVPWIAALALITVIAAALGTVIPARRAAGMSVTEALRYE